MTLNNINQIKRLDTDLKLARSINALPEQIEHVLSELNSIKIPKNYAKINNIVINGMGGSNLGARIIKSVFADQIKIPLNVEPGYEVPNYADKNTLYLISSYSGNTEEPLDVYKEVKKRKCKIIGITSDDSKNKLKKLMQTDKIPGYIFNPKINPTNQPRMGVGYSIFGIISILSKINIIKINQTEIKQIIKDLKKLNTTLDLDSLEQNNPAKQIAKKLYNKIPILVASEFLKGNVQTLRNQFSESSKNFISYLTLPELNHYSMEGLSHPKSNQKNLIFFFFDSNLYHPRIQKRSELTKEVIKKNKILVIDYKLKSKTKLAQSFEMLQIGSWITYYLGILNKINPVEVPWVNWFKKQLG